ncbi:MAG: fatty acyl-AMP ligase [Acidobacteriota bacterium]
MNTNRKEQRTIVDAVLSYASATPDRLAFRFLGDGDVATERLNYCDLDARCRAIAACLQRADLIGERVLLCFEPGLSFVCAFLGSLYAGAVPVPVAVPRTNRSVGRLRSIVLDCNPRLAITSRSQHRRWESLLEAVPELRSITCLIADDMDAMAAGWDSARPEPSALAFLQYTSGSISAPKGVAVTHANIVTNQEQIKAAFGHDDSTIFVGWLPLFHDMGLIGNILQPLYLGIECTLLPPLAFIQKPIRWLRAISDYKGTTSGAPNFAYDHCVSRIEQTDLAGMDLSSWRVAFNGAEPVRAETIRSFSQAFAPAGFSAETFYPCYGLAEATLFVCGDVPGDAPVVLQADASAIESGKFRHASGEGSSREFVSSGIIRADQQIRIVDPSTLQEMPGGEIGEIWVAGENVAPGYWNRVVESSSTFAASLENTGSLRFLRTGDLGFVHNGRLFVAGRLKDLIIIRGRNLYPQDIEWTVSHTHKFLVPNRCAAFSVEEAGEEQVVVVQEVKRKPSTPLVLSEVVTDIHSAVVEHHDVALSTICLVGPGGVPFTSSGKVRRAHCRRLFLDGELPVIGDNWNRHTMHKPNFISSRTEI